MVFEGRRYTEAQWARWLANSIAPLLRKAQRDAPDMREVFVKGDYLLIELGQVMAPRRENSLHTNIQKAKEGVPEFLLRLSTLAKRTPTASRVKEDTPDFIRQKEDGVVLLIAVLALQKPLAATQTSMRSKSRIPVPRQRM